MPLPGLRMHLSPSFGKGTGGRETIISAMFKPGQTGRIPIVAVTGTNGKTTTVRLISHLLAQSGLCVGMTNTDGVYVGAHCIDTGDCSGPKAPRAYCCARTWTPPSSKPPVASCAKAWPLTNAM